MLSSLSKLDPLSAAGVVARTAVSIHESGNPAGAEILPHEDELRAALLAEIRQKLGIPAADTSKESISRLEDALDDALDLLVEPKDETEALNNLSAQGNLPSDLYNVVADEPVTRFFGEHLGTELDLMERTIREAEREQHYGPSDDADSPFLVSLFAKRFTSVFPHKSFTMLVAGRRGPGLLLTITHAFRIYADLIPPRENEPLVGLLERFADQFGLKISVNGKTGHFFLSEELGGNDLSFEVTRPSGDSKVEGQIACFWQTEPSTGKTRASLILGINLTKYRRLVDSRGWAVD